MTNDTATPRRISSAVTALLPLFLLLLTSCAPQAPQSKAQVALQHLDTKTSFQAVAETTNLFGISQTLQSVDSDGDDIELNEDRFAEPSVSGKLKLIRPPAGTRLGSPFGLRYHPIKHRRILHSGVDISGKRGEKVVASAPGRIIFSGRKGAYGLMIDLDAGNGVVLRYAHLDKLAVKKGAIVRQGQYIGNLGRTGRVTAPHLHFEVRLNNKPVNPMKYIDPDHAWASNTDSSTKKGGSSVSKKF